jgi:signal peptidase I
MSPTLCNGDYVVVERTRRDPTFKLGAIIVFMGDSKHAMVKRVVALPGQTVMVYGNKVMIDGVAQNDAFRCKTEESGENEGAQFDLPSQAKFTDQVEHSEVFVLGDNRLNSIDSRILGNVSYERVVGPVRFVIPLGHPIVGCECPD